MNLDFAITYALVQKVSQKHRNIVLSLQTPARKTDLLFMNTVVFLAQLSRSSESSLQVRRIVYVCSFSSLPLVSFRELE